MDLKIEKGIHINKDGINEVKLFTHTDQVLQQPSYPYPAEQRFVRDNWPEELKNMLVISINGPRLKRFYQRIGSLREYVTLIEGVDGKSLYDKPVESMTRGQIGCFMSHQKAWQRIIDKKLAYGFILEDDCEITPNNETLIMIKTALKEIGSLKWDVLFVGRNPALCKIRKRIRTHVVQVGKTWGLFAYVITNKAARELLACSYPISEPVDIFVSTTRNAAKIKLGISPIPFIVVDEKSDTVDID